MPERPDSPIPQPPQEPVAHEEQHVVPHVSQRKKRKRGVGGEGMELQLTSMIDVIFQLLIYFVITANFMIDEGTILATMPGNAAETDKIQPPDPPKVIQLTTSDDGVTVRIAMGNLAFNNVTELYAYLNDANASKIKKDDPVQIKPQGVVRWQHVVNVFNACVRANLKEVGFAPS